MISAVGFTPELDQLLRQVAAALQLPDSLLDQAESEYQNLADYLYASPELPAAAA